MSPEEIVRKLAAAQPPISSSMDGPCCALCDTYPPHRELTQHSPRCPWRMAREWVEQNPPGGRSKPPATPPAGHGRLVPIG